MVNETSEENLLEFSKKVLDAAFGLCENNNIEVTPSTAEEPAKDKNVQASTIIPLPLTVESKIKPRSEKKKVKINIPSFQGQPVNDHKERTSSDSATSIKAKTSNNSDDMSDTSTNLNFKEDTTETSLRSPGLMEMRLKRKSIMGSEEEDPNFPLNSDELHIETDNPSHLFWVPAHLHPEIAPNEFRKWLKYHSKDEINSGLASLRRRKSTLSKQYIPSEVEDDEETTDNKEESKKKSNGFDWESFGESDGIVNHSSESTKLNILRRSLSLNLPPFIGGTISNPNDPNIFDRHSSPDVDSKILVPRMAPALKRTARTKIRRNSVAGEQNPRRFSAHRRTRSTHISSDKGKRDEDKIIPKKRSESALSVPFILPQVETEKVDMNFINNVIVDEPEEISKNVELDCIDVKDGMGPIRIVLEDNGPEVNVTPPQRKSSFSSDADPSFNKLKVEPSHDKSNLLQVDTSIQSGTALTPPASPTSPASPTTAQSSTKRASAWSWLWSGGSEEKLKEKEKDGEKDKEEKKEKESKPKKKEKEKDGEKDKEEKKEKESKPKKKEKEKDGDKDKEEKKEKESKPKKKEKEKDGDKDKEEKKEKESKLKKKEKEKDGDKDKEEKKEKESKPKKKEKEKEGEKDEEKKEKESKLKKNKSDKSDKVEKSEKSEKSDKNEKENNDSAVKEKDKEKSQKISLSSIFSWPSQNKGKSTEDSSTTTNPTTPLPQPTTPNKKTKYTNYNRLPIHVERAIYRLSHIKLANPRRPLHEQVLISNMMFWYLSLINKQQVEYGGSSNPNAEMAVQIVKSKVGKEKGGRKRRKGEKKSGLTRKGAGSSAEIAYKAPQYDMNQIPQQYLSNEYEEITAEDYSDNDYQSEEEIKAHSYQYYNDEYLSDGTDGGYLDETNGRIESSHGGDLLNSSAEFDDKLGESSSGDKNIKNYVRSSPNGRSKSPTGKRPSPNGRSTSPTSKNRNSVSSNVQRKSVPPSSTRKPANVSRNRASIRKYFKSSFS
ncbi:7827_t:CDS:2 [Funneliformis mosseae]|uniref:7827_t:CDS:1 n=1 Tax=Funneliformis mosseae TaxID=27381 RepID=A0A9N9BI00_FUNMO|nr:7827_t:CDS:2 [Funneliformis mosseae]